MSSGADDLTREEKRLDALAAGEARIHERLLTLRGELDVLAHAIDRITMPRRPRMHAYAAAAAGLSMLDNLLSFPRPTRGKRR